MCPELFQLIPVWGNEIKEKHSLNSTVKRLPTSKSKNKKVKWTEYVHHFRVNLLFKSENQKQSEQ